MAGLARKSIGRERYEVFARGAAARSDPPAPIFHDIER